jgi:phage shock protein C
MTREVLRRSRNSILGGVCAGLAEYYGWEVKRTRAVYFVATFFTGGAGIVVYISLLLLMPPPMQFDINDYRAQ